MAEIRVKTKKPVAELNPGDSLEVGVSSEVKIDRDSNWISLKVITYVGPEETGTQAHDRAQAFVMEKFEKTVHSTVQKIQEMGS